MKTTVRKLFYNMENEEKWLNEMATKGMACTNISWGRYDFSQSQPGEYIYRIELLEDPPKHEKSRDYIAFLEENGIEVVDSYMNWIYLRKKATDGEFEIYSDIDSRIKHYQRINTFYTILIACLTATGIINIMNGLRTESNLYLIALILGIISILGSIGLFFVNRPVYQQLKHLKRERDLRE